MRGGEKTHEEKSYQQISEVSSDRVSTACIWCQFTAEERLIRGRAHASRTLDMLDYQAQTQLMAQWHLTANSQLSAWHFHVLGIVVVDTGTPSLSRRCSVFHTVSLNTCDKGAPLLTPRVSLHSAWTLLWIFIARVREEVNERRNRRPLLFRRLRSVRKFFFSPALGRSHIECFISFKWLKKKKKVKSQYCRPLRTGACIINVFA